MEENIHKTKRRRSSRKKKSKNKIKFLGFGLIIFGLAVSLYSFGAVDSFKELFTLPNFRDYIHLWPVLIVLFGFFFVIKDYMKKSTEKWD